MIALKESISEFIFTKPLVVWPLEVYLNDLCLSNFNLPMQNINNN